jgi:hypothetical protein
MIRRGIRLVSVVAIATASGLPLPAGVVTAHACGTSVDGMCVVPPDPVIVEGPTGPFMVDGLEATLTATVDVSMVNGQRIINATYPQETVNGVPASSTTPNGNVDLLGQGSANDTNWDWGGCGGGDMCSNIQIVREYSYHWQPQGSFNATGPAVFNWLEPTTRLDRQYYLMSMHSQVTSNDANQTTLCILTNSAEIQGAASPAPQIVDWNPGAPYSVSSGQSVSFNVSTSANGVGIGVGSTWNIAEGKVEGKVYQPGDNTPSTGYVGAWEQSNGCKSSVELRNGVIWAQGYHGNDDTYFKLAANVWYASSN